MMVALSPSISINRGADHTSAMPSLKYQASVQSSHSQACGYGYKISRNNSLEQLVPKQKGRVDNQQRYKARAQIAKDGMESSKTAAMNIERKKSFGIGGAGNIRESHCLKA